MVLAGTFDAARKGEWAAALRDHQRHTGPGFGKDPIVPDRKTVFEDLVTLLDGRLSVSRDGVARIDFRKSGAGKANRRIGGNAGIG